MLPSSPLSLGLLKLSCPDLHALLGICWPSPFTPYGRVVLFGWGTHAFRYYARAPHLTPLPISGIWSGSDQKLLDVRMGQDQVEKCVERLLQSIDDLLGAQQGSGAPENSGLSDLIDKYKKSLSTLEANWSRLQLGRQRGIPKPDQGLACGKIWIDIFFKSKLALRIGLVLATVREQVEAATVSRCPVSRCVSLRTVPSIWVKEIVARSS